jgi:hypothetical protein
MSKAKFTQVAPNEVRIDYKGHKFMLIEKDRGVYGMGKAVQLYVLEGFEKKHLKEVAWTKTDNHNPGKDMKNALLTHFATMDECKKAAVKYIDQLM